MTTPEWPIAEIALVISVLSLALSLANLVWNVWSKFIFPKPKLEVYAGYFVSGKPTDAETCHYIVVTVVNHGPSTASVKLLIARSRNWHSLCTRRFKQWIIKHWGETNANIPPVKLPSKIEPGGEEKFVFDGNSDWFSEEKSFQVGVVDIYGRKHFASIKDMKKIKASQDKYK